MSDKDAVSMVSWSISKVLADTYSIKQQTAEQVSHLLDEGATVPFIARYRREICENMAPELLHHIKDKYEELQEVIEYVGKTHKKLKSQGHLTNELMETLQSCKTVDQVEYIKEPYKSISKGSLVQRAIDAGLQFLADKVLNFEPVILAIDKPTHLTDKEAISGTEHLIARYLYQNVEVLQWLEKSTTRQAPHLVTTANKKTENQIKKDGNKNHKEACLKKDFENFEIYMNFDRNVRQLQPHQIMAINRAEKRMIVMVKVEFATQMERDFSCFCENLLQRRSQLSRKGIVDCCDGKRMLKCGIAAAWSHLRRYMERTIRRDLSNYAQRESLRVFKENLRCLLMTPPVRGVKVLGLDPGFSHGCKAAVVSADGSFLEHAIVYLRSGVEQFCSQLGDLLRRHDCSLVALGDGVGSRETERFLGEGIRAQRFFPDNFRFVVVSECGASVWSASADAASEAPLIDVAIRGALSIARRLQDPLAEFVKMEPRSLGVGMYQHDIPEKQLLAAVKAILEECISFVGVDVNYSTEHVLLHVSGLTKRTASAIVAYRQEHGHFANRQELLLVPGIGKRTFQQCAGFLRIVPPSRGCLLEDKDNRIEEPMEVDDEIVVSSSGANKRRRHVKSTLAAGLLKQRRVLSHSKESLFEPLDCTSIHPEMYDAARCLLRRMGFTSVHIGQTKVREAAEQLLKKEEILLDIAHTCAQTSAANHLVDGDLSIGLESMRFVAECLTRDSQFDERLADNVLEQMPLFLDTVYNIESLSIGQHVLGVIANVTTFGIFVNIGCPDCSAFTPKGIFPDVEFKLGQRVSAQIASIDVHKNRIRLSNMERLLRTST